MEVIKVTGDDAREAIEQALNIFAGGGVVAYPTETFYGLGARFNDEAAIKRIFQLKGRPEDKPVSLIMGSEASLELVAADVSDAARALIERYWPGPLTVIFKAREGLLGAIAHGGKVAARVPGESFGLKLAQALAFPITATSANPSEEPPPSNAEEVVKYFPEGIDLLIDAGPTPGGKPSTVVDASSGKIEIVRAGAVDIPEAS